MTAEIIKLPYSVTRGAHSRKPRRSKNGTPEQRAARLAAAAPPADIVPFSVVASVPVEPGVDRRSLRGSPLREHITPISLAATIVGKMHTADLKEIAIDIGAAERENWAATLQAGIGAAKFAICELEKATDRLANLMKSPGDLSGDVNFSDPALGQSVLNVEQPPSAGEFFQTVKQYVCAGFDKGRDIDQIFDELIKCRIPLS